MSLEPLADRRPPGSGPQPALEQRTLHESGLVQIGYIAVRPVSAGPGDVEVSERNVLALPLAGVFAKHDGPRQVAVATPNHALLITAGKPYRLSFPGCIGDRCLALRWTGEALARLGLEATADEGFDTDALDSHVLLAPGQLVARGRLWHRLARGRVDPLEAEELACDMLDVVLSAARRRRRGRGQHAAAPRGPRHVARAIEAIAVQPERRWTLDELGALTHVSPGHLAYVFRAEVGIPVYEYVVRSRLAHALDAVLDSDASLTTIALDAGFASHSHFTARFRARFGHTPLELRRSLSGAAARHLRRIATASARATA